MKKITQQIATALLNRSRKSIDNTVCTGTSVLLHGNEIARISADGKLEVTLAGWPTVTTRERVNGILSEFNCGCRIVQIKGEQWCGGRTVSSTEWIPVC